MNTIIFISVLLVSAASFANSDSLKIEGKYNTGSSFHSTPATLNVVLREDTAAVQLQLPSGVCTPQFSAAVLASSSKERFFGMERIDVYTLKMSDTCQATDFYKFQRRLVVYRDRDGQVKEVRLTGLCSSTHSIWAYFSGILH